MAASRYIADISGHYKKEQAASAWPIIDRAAISKNARLELAVILEKTAEFFEFFGAV